MLRKEPVLPPMTSQHLFLLMKVVTERSSTESNLSPFVAAPVPSNEGRD